MTDYSYDISFAYYQGALLPGAVFTFTDSAGSPAVIKDLNGATVTQLVADSLGVIPGFIAVDASTGFLTNPSGLRKAVVSQWAQDPGQVRSAVETAAATAQTAATQATGAVSPLAAAINALSGRVATLESSSGSGGSGPAPVPGTRTQLVILASDYGGAWPTPARLTGSTSYSVTFRGPIDAPAPAPAGDASGMQPGDSYDYTGS